MRRLIKFFNSLLCNKEEPKFTPATIRFLEEAVENLYGVDLNVAQHGHDEVKLKRFFVMFIIDKTDWSVTELHRRLEQADIKAKGLSRRTLQYYVNTFEDSVTDENIGKAVEFGREYNRFYNKLNSIL